MEIICVRQRANPNTNPNCTMKNGRQWQWQWKYKWRYYNIKTNNFVNDSFEITMIINANGYTLKANPYQMFEPTIHCLLNFNKGKRFQPKYSDALVEYVSVLPKPQHQRNNIKAFLFPSIFAIKCNLEHTFGIVWTRNEQTWSMMIKRKWLRYRAALIFYRQVKRNMYFTVNL